MSTEFSPTEANEGLFRGVHAGMTGMVRFLSSQSGCILKTSLLKVHFEKFEFQGYFYVVDFYT